MFRESAAQGYQISYKLQETAIAGEEFTSHTAVCLNTADCRRPPQTATDYCRLAWTIFCYNLI